MAKTKNNKADYTWGILRISLGFTFLWAFLDKMFGLGFATCRQETGEVVVGCAKAVVEGGSPTTGFLKFGTDGPLANFYQGLAGNGFVDFMFMFGLFAIGTALILGIGMKIAVVTGSLLLMMMWSASIWPENNPFMDDHVIYSVALFGLLFVNDNQKLGLGKWWSKTKLVKNYPILK